MKLIISLKTYLFHSQNTIESLFGDCSTVQPLPGLGPSPRRPIRASGAAFGEADHGSTSTFPVIELTRMTAKLAAGVTALTGAGVVACVPVQRGATPAKRARTSRTRSGLAQARP